jgi:hypothetical protein
MRIYALCDSRIIVYRPGHDLSRATAGHPPTTTTHQSLHPPSQGHVPLANWILSLVKATH